MAVAAVHVLLRTPKGVLVVKRAKDGMYAFPGGKIERGEGILDAAKREFQEEMGVPMPQDSMLEGWVKVEYDGKHFVLLLVESGQVIEPRIKKDEICEVVWVPDKKLRDIENWHPIAKRQIEVLWTEGGDYGV